MGKVIPFAQAALRVTRDTVSKAARSTDVDDEAVEHVETGIAELDRVLGGGIVLGGAYLLSGDPGAGKSTLMLQMLSEIANNDERGLYVSAEETIGQIGARGRRLGLENDHMLLYSSKDLDEVIRCIEETEPAFVVIDSVQTIRSNALDSPAGSTGQVKEVSSTLIELCKELDIACFLIGHVTKDGVVAGPKVMEHLVDTTLSFEGGHELRILRANKNRFGPTNEIGVFEMTGKGMTEVDSPSSFLLKERSEAPGSVVVAACDGARPMLVEVQALVGEKGKLSVSGLDANRVAMILAVVREYVESGARVFLNVAGGARVTDPGADLGIAISVISSAMKESVRQGVCCFGEVGLGGEARAVPRAQARIEEAARMGFKEVLIPATTTVDRVRGIRITRVRDVAHAIAIALSPSPSVERGKMKKTKKERR